jgi:hypothetical protein
MQGRGDAHPLWSAPSQLKRRQDITASATWRNSLAGLELPRSISLRKASSRGLRRSKILFVKLRDCIVASVKWQEASALLCGQLPGE